MGNTMALHGINFTIYYFFKCTIRKHFTSILTDEFFLEFYKFSLNKKNARWDFPGSMPVWVHSRTLSSQLYVQRSVF